MVVERIVPHGMCAGVRAAVNMAMRHPGAYCLHGVVHSEIVTEELKSRGCRFVEDIEDVPDGSVVVFSAHGVAPAVRARALEKGLDVGRDVPARRKVASRSARSSWPKTP